MTAKTRTSASTPRRTVFMALFAFALVALPATAQVTAPIDPNAERTQDGKVFGMPEARITTEAYDGPPVVGSNVTLLPELAPLPPGNHVWDVRIDVVVREIEIADGVRYQAWTFGGSVPGPVVHVREGDRIRFTMMNRTATAVDLTPPSKDPSPYITAMAERDPQKGTPSVMPMWHSMDFHAGTVAPNDKWRRVEPGQTVRFEYVANYPGVYVYHCGIPPVLQHMSMGQYGAVVVSPKDGYPTDAKVNREYVVVQSEFYLKPADTGSLYELDFPAALAKQPSHVAFNGSLTGMMKRPLTANVGDRVRLYVLNVGPSDTESFHVIGTIFDRVWYEGNPHNEMWGMQTVLLGASNGAVVEFIAPEPGEYAMVDHEFADAIKGAVGKLVVGPESAIKNKPVLPAMSH